MEIRKGSNVWVSFIFLMTAMISLSVFAQQSELYQIHINDLRRDVRNNVFGVPRSADCTVYWKVYQREGIGLVQADEGIFDYFRVSCIDLENSNDIESENVVQSNYYSFQNKQAGIKFGFVVEGYKDSKQLAVSDTAWTVVGKLRADAETENVIWHHFIPFNGRIPLYMIGREHFFDAATKAGKIAFHLIWNFLLVGLVIWLGYCIRNLNLRYVFPMNKGLLIGVGHDEIYKRKESKEFKRILDEWRNIIKKANDNIRQELGHGQQVNIMDIEGANAKFWRDVGSRSINRLIDRLDRPGMNKYPVVRIMKAGLENHELGGFHWVEVSKEVDRAIENRASSELEKLRRKSLLDWLWNLGTLSPLIGLFGTATGISHAFSTLTFLPANITQSELVKRLAGGIYEALWTTIEGLAVGLFLMMLYYYYHNKLNWIYSKWEDLYVYVTEKL